MIAPIFERIFSMGAFDALRILRIHMTRMPDIDIIRVIQIVRSIDADSTALDFDAAAELHRLVSQDISVSEAHEFYRHCIAGAILTQKMSWGRSITLGRDIFLKQLSRDEQQCFRAARLLDNPPDKSIISWWDGVSGQIRLVLDQTKMDRARDAEQLSYDYELARLSRLGISELPQWVGFNNTTAGYDLLSYDQGPMGLVNRLIEVKSTVRKPLKFIVSRNEWEQAVKFGPVYNFHIWNMDIKPPKLYERTVEEVRVHIPEDQQAGRWTYADIPVGAS